MRNTNTRRKPTPTKSHAISSLNTKNLSENSSLQEETNFKLLNKNDQDMANAKKKFKKMKANNNEDEVDQIVG